MWRARVFSVELTLCPKSTTTYRPRHCLWQQLRQSSSAKLQRAMVVEHGLFQGSQVALPLYTR